MDTYLQKQEKKAPAWDKKNTFFYYSVLQKLVWPLWYYLDKVFGMRWSADPLKVFFAV